MPSTAPAQIQPTPGTQFRHYKGGLYTVVGTCLIEATLQPGVLYRPCQGDKQDVIWMRPLENFMEQVTMAEGWVRRFAPVAGKIDADPPLGSPSR